MEHTNPVVLNHVIANLGQITRKHGARIARQPRHVLSCPPRVRVREQFWTPMRAILEHATSAHHKRLPPAEMGKILDDANRLLRLAPQPHLRRLACLSEAASLSVLEVGVWIYALWSPWCQDIYVGQTGALRAEKMCIQLWRQNRQMTRRWELMFAGGAGMGKLYGCLRKTGFQKWFILPLQKCSRESANHLERRWMLRVGATLNTRDMPKTSRRYQLLLNAKLLGDIRPPDVLPMAQKIISGRKHQIPVAQQLQVLTMGKKTLPGST